MKQKTGGGGSVRDIKAAELDRVVKAELARKRAAAAGKISRLRALRLAREAGAHSPNPKKRKTESPTED
jgi:hypothetical protein